MSATRTALMLAAVTALIAATSCTGDTPSQRAATKEPQSETPSVQDSLIAQAPPVLPARFGTIGRRATSAEIHAWNIDANAAGVGLPPGRGTYARGAALFAAQCAPCHGVHGEGIGPYPKLIGREPREGFPFGQDTKYVKTIGNYWPYATTVYDYINRAMPFPAPGSLPPDDVYSLVDFLLAENEIVDRRTVMDARTLRSIHMPAHDRFVVDNRRGGRGFR
jgi:S-disulfanyl-L-cysteine oxidoreductase SoxD